MEPWTTASSIALQVFKHRSVVRQATSTVRRLVLGQTVRVVITGEAGVGKSVLADDLVGKLRRENELPKQSIKTERRRRRRKRMTVKMEVLPGQDSMARTLEIVRIFSGSRRFSGVVHVVANGFTELRSGTIVVPELAGVGTLAEYRERWRQAELQDFRNVTRELAKHYSQHRGRVWLILVVNKADLFYGSSEMAEAKRYYAEEASSFVQELRSLQGRLGEYNFSWTVVQASSLSQDFVFGDEKAVSHLDHSERRRLQANLYELIETLGGTFR